MGLKIKKTKGKKILILGTSIELPEVYCRLEFAARADGQSMEVAPFIFASKEAYKAGANALSTDIPSNAFSFQIEKEEMQDNITAEKYAKIYYEQKEYAVE